jgi:hypothetical protein
MTDETVQSIIDIKGKTSGVDEAAASTRKLGDAIEGVSVQSDKTSRSTLSVERSFESLQKRVDVTHRAIEQQKTSLKTLDDAKGQGLVTDARYAELQGLIARRYNETVSAAGNVSKATAGFTQTAGLARHELINLSRQAQDVAVSLGSGQSFGTVLLQQGTQIGDVFASSGGTVKGFFNQVLEGASKIITPTRLVAGGIAAIGLEAAYAGYSWGEARREIDKALIGIGRTSGVTAEDVNRVSAQAAQATSTSFADAQAGAAQLLKTGAVYKETFGELNLITDKFALATGTTTVEAAKKLGDAFADPVKGAETLNKEYGFLTASTLAQIRTYVQLGDAQNAQLTLIRAFEPTLDKLNEKTGFLTTSWRALWNTGSNITSMLGSGLAGGGSDQEQLANLKSQRQDLESRGTPAAGARGTIDLPDPAALDAVNQKIAELEANIKKAAAATASAQLDKLGLQVDAITRAAQPAIGQLEALEAAYSKLAEAKERGASDPESDRAARAIQVQSAALVGASAEADQYAKHVSAIGIAYGDVSTRAALALHSMENQLPVAQAVGGEAKRLAQYQAAVNTEYEKSGNLQEAIKLATGQYQLSQAAALATSQESTRALNDQNELAKTRTKEEEKLVAARQAYNNTLRETGSAAAAEAAAMAVTNRYNTEAEQNARKRAAAYRSAADAAEREAVSLQRAAQASANAWQETENARTAALGGQTQAAFGSQGSPGNNPFGTSGPVGSTSPGTSAAGYTSTSDAGAAIAASWNWAKNTYVAPPLSLSQRADALLQGQGLDAAIKTLQATGPQAAQPGRVLDATFGRPYSSYGLPDIVSAAPTPAISQSEILNQVRQLYELKNAQTDDKSVQASNLQQELDWLRTQPQNLETLKATLELEASIKALTSATVDSAEAITTLPDVLSSLYKSGQVKGFGFADGGIMTPFGPGALRHYDTGGVVKSPQVFMAGENYKPEAIIPLKNGAVPVQFGGSIPITVKVVSDNSGNGGARTIQFNVQGPMVGIINQGGGESLPGAAGQLAADLMGAIDGMARR